MYFILFFTKTEIRMAKQVRSGGRDGISVGGGYKKSLQEGEYGGNMYVCT
jgi:hypothetical protein